MLKSNADRALGHTPTVRNAERADVGESFIVADKRSIYLRQSFEKYAERREIVLHYSGNNEKIAWEQKRKVLYDILFNWLSHCTLHGRASLSVSVKPDSVNTDAESVLVVEGDNIGLAPKDLPEVFYRFCLSESGRIVRAKLSAGLLYSKVILDLDGGTMSVETRKLLNGSSIFTRFLFTVNSGDGRSHNNGLWSESPIPLSFKNDIQIESILFEGLGEAGPVGIAGGPKSVVSTGGNQHDHSNDQFLRKLMALLESHVSDPDFNVSKLVSEIGMSRPVLFRKAKILTGSSIINLIRSKRLKMAEMLLKQRNVAVSEVAFKVGYTDPKYFSKSFRSKFGKTPKEYAHGL